MTANPGGATERVLTISTSNTSPDDTGKPAGVWAEELVVPYYQLIDAGASVKIATPKGGSVAFDPGSVKPTGQNDALTERFLADQATQANAHATQVCDQPSDSRHAGQGHRSVDRALHRAHRLDAAKVGPRAHRNAEGGVAESVCADRRWRLSGEELKTFGGGSAETCSAQSIKPRQVTMEAHVRPIARSARHAGTW